MKRMLLSMALAWGTLSGPLAIADCASTVNDAYAWASKRDGRYEYVVDFMLSTMKAPTKFVHYSNGTFTLGSDGQLSSGQTPAVFSDRAWCPNNSGPFCAPYQKFDYRKADQMTFTLQHNGVLKVVLNTWGNATYNVSLQCTNGFLYGSLVEANGSSFVTMNLKKTTKEIIR